MLNKLLKFIAHQFSNPNGWCGYLATFIMNCNNRKQYITVQKYISLKSGEKVLDIGFGNGFLIRHLYKKFPFANFYGIDISTDMLHIATKRSATAIQKGNMHLFSSDVMSMPFKNNSFDIVYTINTMYFWKDIDKSLQEINRIMKDNASFIIVNHYQHYLDKLPITKYNFKKYSINEIINLLNDNGFMLIENKCIEKNKSYCLIAKKQEKAL